MTILARPVVAVSARRVARLAAGFVSLAMLAAVNGTEAQIASAELERVAAELAAIEADIRAAGVTPEFEGLAPEVPTTTPAFCKRKLEDIEEARQSLDERLPDIREDVELALEAKDAYRKERWNSDVECGDEAMAMIGRVEALLELPELSTGAEEIEKLRTCIFDGKERINARRVQIEQEEGEPGLQSAQLRRLARVEESYDDEETRIDATGQAFGKAADLATRLLTEMHKERASCESILDF